MYGGRVTDSRDRRLLKVYADEIFDEEGALKDKYTFSIGYSIPEIKSDLQRTANDLITNP